MLSWRPPANACGDCEPRRSLWYEILQLNWNDATQLRMANDLNVYYRLGVMLQLPLEAVLAHSRDKKVKMYDLLEPASRLQPLSANRVLES